MARYAGWLEHPLARPEDSSLRAGQSLSPFRL